MAVQAVVNHGKTGLRADIEFARVVCAFGIVWYHSGAPGHAVSYAALVVFCFLSVFLLKSDVEESFASFWARARRLLIPWLIWMFLYAGYNILRGRPVFDSGYTFLEKVLSGSQLHLWYLPFIFFCLCIIRQIDRLRLPGWLLSTVAACGYVFAMLFAEFWRPVSIKLGTPWAQYFHALPAVALGVYFRSANELGSKSQFAAIMFMGVSTLLTLNIEGVGVTYATGLVIAAVIFYSKTSAFSINMLARLSELGKYSLGIYLSHPLFLIAASRLVEPKSIAMPLVASLGSLFWVAWMYRLNPDFSRRFI